MTTNLDRFRYVQASVRLADQDPYSLGDDYEDFLCALARVSDRSYSALEAMDWDGIIAVMAEVNAKFDAETTAKADTDATA
jgi:hypothetical protein